MKPGTAIKKWTSRQDAALEHLFVTENMTSRQVGELLGFSPNSVHGRCSYLGIRKREGFRECEQDQQFPPPMIDCEPTTAGIGSADKVEIMAMRFAAGETLMSDDDESDCRGDFSESSNKEIEKEREDDG